MKVRHVLFLIGIAAVMAAGLASCALFGIISVSDRITDFQNDLNSSTRATIYQDFHPTLTSDYDALKDPAATIDTVIPRLSAGNPNYSLQITDQSSPSNGVYVTISGGGFPSPEYLKLVMEVTGAADNRIVSLELQTTQSFPGPPQIK